MFLAMDELRGMGRAKMRAFERLEGEGTRAYNAFQRYLELGPERTLALAADAVYGRTTKGKRRTAPGTIRKWAEAFDWHARAQAWDDLLTMVRLEGIEDAEREKSESLAERNQKLDEDILHLKELLIPRLKQMAQFPLVRTTKTNDEGTEITHVHPARWSFNTLVNAIGVLREIPDPDGASVVINMGKGEPDLSVLSDEELEQLADINEKLANAATPRS